MQDKIEKIGKTVIQHGKINNRVYLMKTDPDEAPEIIPRVETLAIEKGYTKIFAKVASRSLPLFLMNGYVPEAFIPEFYKDRDDCILLARYFDPVRCKVPADELHQFNEIMQACVINKPGQNRLRHFEPVELYKDDTPELAKVFEKVFESYPFPVFDPKYLVQTIEENGTRYFGIRQDGKLTGASTAEIDVHNRNAEMTDFAVLPQYRGQKLASYLLSFMEEKMRIENIHTVYTIARLKEPGMNKTFLNAGYTYTGTLFNNTNIGGTIESMNVLYKKI